MKSVKVLVSTCLQKITNLSLFGPNIIAQSEKIALYVFLIGLVCSVALLNGWLYTWFLYK